MNPKATSNTTVPIADTKYIVFRPNIRIYLAANNVETKQNIFCILPESFNTNISHQLLDYKITFVNSQYQNTNSKGNLNSNTGFKCMFLKFLVLEINLLIQNIYYISSNSLNYFFPIFALYIPLSS